MHHVIARLDFSQGSQELFLAHLRYAAAPDPLTEQFFLGDHHQAGGGKPEAARDVADEDFYSPSPTLPRWGRERDSSPQRGEAGRGDEYIPKSRFADGAVKVVWFQKLLEPFGLRLLMTRDRNQLAFA